MKLTDSKFILIAAVTSLLMSCGQKQSAAKQNIDADIEAQIISNNPCDASSACSKSFVEAVRKQNEDGGTEFCDELLKRSDADLAVCEVEIRNSKYDNLLASCKSTLVQRLQKVVKIRNAGLQVYADVYSENDIGLGFKMSTQVQYRDVSHGYMTTDGGVQSKQVVLTFDDGPEPTNTRSVLRTLEEAGAKAHFFQMGQRIQASPDVTRLAAQLGHSMGNHSWSHPNMRALSFEDGVAQIRKTQSILFKVLGWADPFFRFPYGNRTAALDQMLAENQTADFYWTVDTNDWRMVNEDKTVRTNAQVIKDTMNQLDRRGKGIILMHDIHRRTAELLPEMLRLLNDRGYSVVMLQPTDEKTKANSSLVYKTERVASGQ